jgi:uncharacterized membrane protein YqgA involved in biofilm formation
VILEAVSGTILNAVAIGATTGLVAATKVSTRLEESLITALGLLTLTLAASMVRGGAGRRRLPDDPRDSARARAAFP